MLIIAYPADAGFLERAPFAYQFELRLAEMDQLLADDRLVLRVSLDLVESAAHATETGRPATPAEVTLRLAVLRRLMGWSYRKLEEEVKGSLKWRCFCHIYGHAVLDHSTIQAREALIKPETLHALNDLVIKLAYGQGLTKGKKMRVDSSVVETHIHYPTDSSLLADAVRVLGRTVERAREEVDGRTVRWHAEMFCDQGRQAKHLAKQIAFLSRRQGKNASKKANSERKMRCLYEKLVTVAQDSLEHAQQVLELLSQRAGNLRAIALTATLEHFLPLIRRVIGQTQQRVFKGLSLPASEKVVSLFEPHTAIIQRGKAGPRETEFGRKLWLSEVDGGLVSEYRIQLGNPPDNQEQFISSLKHHRKLFRHSPTTVTGDRGVHSAANETAAKRRRIPQIALPKPGAKDAERRTYEAQSWFKAALRFRAGIEGRISVLRGPRGLRRCLNRGQPGLERWVGWGIITNNLAVMSTALARRHPSLQPTAS